MPETRDYDDPAAAAEWFREQRQIVLGHLQEQRVSHTGVADEPEWFIAPYVAVWSVGSLASPGRRGWWAVSGDLPTDYLSGHDASDARTAVLAIATRWQDWATYLLADQDPPDASIGPPAMRRELGDLLQRRAQILIEWASQVFLW